MLTIIPKNSTTAACMLGFAGLLVSFACPMSTAGLASHPVELAAFPATALRAEEIPRDGWIDVRNASSPERTVLIVVARKSDNDKGWPGHAFVVIGGESEERRACYEDLYGLYPKSLMSGMLSYAIGEVKGEIKASKEDRETRLIRHRLFIELTVQQRDVLKRLISSKGRDTNYQLASNDCVTFVEHLLTELNKQIPIPEQYRNKLVPIPIDMSDQ